MSANQTLNVRVVGTDSGFQAMMGNVTSGVTRLGQRLGSTNKEMGNTNKYAQALSTTLRYAFAGRVIFGIQNAINNLAEFKTQLGEIDALASQVSKGKLVGLGNQLADVGSEAILMSNKFGIAVGDVESYMERFYSSFEPKGSPKRKLAQMEAYTTAMLNLSTALGTEAGDPQKLAGGLTGLINALPGGRENPGAAAKTIADMFAVVLRKTPSLTGSDIASAAGRFASAKSLSGMSVQQIMAAFGVAAQTGGSPAVIIRGLTQLLGSSLLHPTKPVSKQTYAAAGLPTDPNMLKALGGEKVLEALITYVQAGKGKGKNNMNLDAVYNAFSRQESVRQFVNLLAGPNGGVQALKNFNDALTRGVKTNISTEMAQKRLQQSVLIRMQQASKNLGISLVNSADWPLEHLIADPLIGASNLAARHRTGTQVVVGSALSLGAANALRKMGAFSKLGRLGGFIGRASGLEQAAISGAITKEELPAAIAGGKGDGSRAAPLWVIIAPISWSLGGPQAFSTKGGKSTEAKVVDDVKKYGGFGALLARFGGPAALVAGGVLAGHGAMHAKSTIAQAKAQGKKGFLSSTLWGVVHAPEGIGAGIASDIHGLLGGSSHNADGFWKLYHQQEAAKRHASGNVNVHGSAHIDVELKYEDLWGMKKSLKRGIDANLVPSAKQFPTAQGKAGSRKAQT